MCSKVVFSHEQNYFFQNICCALFIMSCQMKQQMFKVREWKAKLHATTRQEYEEERTEHAAIYHTKDVFNAAS